MIQTLLDFAYIEAISNVSLLPESESGWTWVKIIFQSFGKATHIFFKTYNIRTNFSDCLPTGDALSTLQVERSSKSSRESGKLELNPQIGSDTWQIFVNFDSLTCLKMLNFYLKLFCAALKIFDY